MGLNCLSAFIKLNGMYCIKLLTFTSAIMESLLWDRGRVWGSAWYYGQSIYLIGPLHFWSVETILHWFKFHRGFLMPLLLKWCQNIIKSLSWLSFGLTLGILLVNLLVFGSRLKPSNPWKKTTWACLKSEIKTQNDGKSQRIRDHRWNE